MFKNLLNKKTISVSILDFGGISIISFMIKNKKEISTKNYFLNEKQIDYLLDILDKKDFEFEEGENNSLWFFNKNL